MGVPAGNFGYSYIIVSEEVFDAIHLTLQKGTSLMRFSHSCISVEECTEAEQIRAVFDQHYGDTAPLPYDVQSEQQDIKQVAMASIFLYGFIT